MSANILTDVSPEKCFWVNNGPIVSNLQQLPDVLRQVNSETFLHHVNSAKNDFAAWIRDVIGDGRLADEVSKTRKKSALINILEKRIGQAKKGK